MGWRGGEQQASYLIQGLLERNVQVYAVGRPHSEFSRRHTALLKDDLIASSLRNEMDIFSAIKVSSFIKEKKIDILHAHTSHTHTIACLARMIAGRGKVVVSRRVDFKPKLSWINRKKYRWPDHYVAISIAIKNILIDFGIQENQIAMVHSAIDPARFDVAPCNREDLGFPEDVFLWGNVAHLVPHKDHATLLRGFAKVIKQTPKANLCIVGPGKLESELKALSNELGLGDHVKFLGRRDDVPSLLKMFDGYVMSSNEEGLGTSVLDAMASKLPVVGTDAGGLPEMIKDEETGLLVQSGNFTQLGEKMVAMMKNKDLQKRVVQQATQMIEDEYLVDRMVEGNLAVYESLMDTQ
jgi:glycosyltransferase involved in cell wall biosynthesis